MFKSIKVTLIIAVATLLASCYRIDIQQGNILPNSSISKVRRGMSTANIQKMFGAPILTNAFVDNRLVYVYTFKPGIGDRHEKRLIIYFKNGRVTDFVTDEKKAQAKIPSPFAN